MATGRILDVARGGSRVDMLEAMRDKVAEALDGTESARDIAALTKQLRELDYELFKARMTASGHRKRN